ncbi:MAG TPA: anthranilate phosphoribosyltransferase, partial [Chitinophagales bacterium]|nr:anthranilate phosphoribosyltransferase [Chitinophagales bacterium]
MKNILEIIYAGEILNEDIIYNMMRRIGEGGYTDIEISAFLSALNMRSVSVGELRGLRRAMLELCLPVDLGGIEAMDLCGTGGDGKDTFNISTISSFVVAGAGIPVTKHGNYGVSSKCGSSNVLEALGVTFSNNTDVLKRQLEAANITILHAPLFHPAMKYVAPSRRNMQVKTVFNILGPLTNPTRPKVQVSGVYNLEVGRLYY